MTRIVRTVCAARSAHVVTTFRHPYPYPYLSTYSLRSSYLSVVALLCLPALRNARDEQAGKAGVGS